MFADLSAGSGLNFFTRGDEEHSKGFLELQQDKLIYGSDCSDRIGTGPDCQGTQTIAAIRQLSPDKLPIGNYCMTMQKEFFAYKPLASDAINSILYNFPEGVNTVRVVLKSTTICRCKTIVQV